MKPRWVRLGDWCSQDRVSVRPGEQSDLRYIGLETVESNTGNLLVGELSKTPEEPQANSFRFGPKHVLYGKLRPYLNKVALPDFDGKCSTELVPLLPSPGLDRRYLAYFLRCPSTVSRISERTAGAQMPRADMDLVLALPMPLPAIDVQRRIVDQIARAEGIVRLRLQAERKATELIPALFVAMFGDPVTNPKGWPVRAIEDLCAVATGATPRREVRLYYEGGTVPWVKTSEVGAGEIRGTGEYITDFAITETNCKVFPVDTILIAMYGQGQTRGRAGMLKFPAATNQACAAILPSDRIDQIYLFEMLKMQYERLRAMGRGGNQANLNLGMIKTFGVPTVPVAAQKAFAEKVRMVRSVLDLQATALKNADATIRMLLGQAFTVEGAATVAPEAKGVALDP